MRAQALLGRQDRENGHPRLEPQSSRRCARFTYGDLPGRQLWRGLLQCPLRGGGLVPSFMSTFSSGPGGPQMLTGYGEALGRGDRSHSLHGGP